MNYLEIFTQTIIGFAVLFLLHILTSRLKLKVNEDCLLFLVFLVLPVFYFVFLFLSFSHLSEEIVASSALLFLINAAYIASYPAIYAACPTLRISLLLFRNSNDGLSKEEIQQAIQIKENSLIRIQDAQSNNLIYEKDGNIYLTSFGKCFFYFFKIYRLLLGLPCNTT